MLPQRQSPSRAVARALSAAMGGDWTVSPLHASGFCATWRAERSGPALFVKDASGGAAEMLRAEADGLAALAAVSAVAVPAVRALVDDEESGRTLLAMDWLDLRPPDAGFGACFGAALGALHAAAPAVPGYGWHRGNWLGATAQDNQPLAPDAAWADFFNQRRLAPLAARLAEAGASAALPDAVYAVMERWPVLLHGHRPKPSLIHGDLWSGNWGMLAGGAPVIYDPAVSRSDAEAELAMMELFGSPPAGFWPAYREAAGLDAGYPRRRAVFQLYHLLNHALLFGGGYAAQALGCARDILREAG